MLNELTDFISGGAFGKANDSAQAGVDAFKDVKLPTAEELQTQLYELVNSGQMTPEQAQAVMQESSSLNSISLDPKLKAAQMDALSSLQEIGAGGGLTDMDRSQLAQIQSEEDAAARGGREAILQNYQARGMGGSGLEMLSNLQNQQDSVTRRSTRDTGVAGMAQQRALEALQQAGQLGGQIGNQDFNQKATVAAANDAINQFNTANLNKVGMTNTAANNEAQKFNLEKQYDTNKTNTAIKNTQATNNTAAKQTVADNALKKASGVAGAQAGVTGAHADQGKANTGLFGSILQSGAAAYASDENLKTGIEDFDASAFLDSLTPTKYRYKEPEKFGDGKQVGVMAQDIEKEVPQMVEDTPEGKMVDYNKAGGPIFASLAHLHDRLKKIEGGG